MSDAHPYVSGKRLILACHSASRGGPVTLGVFSCHWAAVAALVRLSQPEFKSLNGDRREDLVIEAGLRDAIARATGTRPDLSRAVAERRGSL